MQKGRTFALRHACAGALLAAWSLAFLAISLPAAAQIGSARYSSIVVDAKTGQVLSAVSPDEQRHPASLTKMMTLYLVFEALRDRRIALHQNVPISAHAAAQSPTKLDLVPGARITVQEAILGLDTKSANDAAAASIAIAGPAAQILQGEFPFLSAPARVAGFVRAVARRTGGFGFGEVERE